MKEKNRMLKYPNIKSKEKTNQINTYQNLIINRTKIFYCTAPKSTPGLFRSHPFNSENDNIFEKMYIRMLNKNAKKNEAL